MKTERGKTHRGKKQEKSQQKRFFKNFMNLEGVRINKTQRERRIIWTKKMSMLKKRFFDESTENL